MADRPSVTRLPMFEWRTLALWHTGGTQKMDWQSEGIFWSAPCQFASVLSHFLNSGSGSERFVRLELNVVSFAPEDVRERWIDRDE